MIVPQARYLVPATMLLSSLAYFMTTISHIFNGSGKLATIEVQINDGRILGLKKISRNGRGYYEFRGIPYATQPRDGYLRFEPPIPPEPWNGTLLDATKYGAFCLQYEVLTKIPVGKESCLFLNVATPLVLSPEEVNSGISNFYPVIVFLYGGGFMRFSNVYNPSYFLDENVILVSLNYRLGVFGFLSTDDGVINGNQGLKDQVMALRWVKDNIKYFNGDPSKVTLMGQSAGGASAHLHSMSPMSKNLFHRAISMSGNALNSFAICKNPREQALRVGRMMNCPTNDTRQMVDCLKSKPAFELNKVNREYTNFLSSRIAFFSPVVETVHNENTFLPDKPINLIRQGKVNQPLIVGANPNDGLFFTLLVVQEKNQVQKLNRQWEKYAPRILGYEDESIDRINNISNAIRHFYFGNKTFGWDTVVDAGTMLSDRLFLEGVHDVVRLQANVTQLFAYEYRYNGDFSLANILVQMKSFLPRPLSLGYSLARNWFSRTILRTAEPRTATDNQICHLDEIPLFFHLPVISKEIIPGSADYSMSTAAISMWTSFARDGKPGNLFNVEWDEVPKNVSSDQDSIRYMKFDDQPSMVSESFRKRIEFWKSLGLDGTTVSKNQIN